jgi:hypothetical protein
VRRVEFLDLVCLGDKGSGHGALQNDVDPGPIHATQSLKASPA